MVRKAINILIVLSIFLSSTVTSQRAHANALSLPQNPQIMLLSGVHAPLLIKGITVYKENPFLFDFIADTGETKLTGGALEEKAMTQIKYFLAALAVPEEDMWVNLSPSESDRIVPQVFGQTDMGRDLLAQDYLLKKMTASLMYPEGEIGKKFWAKIYAQVKEGYGQQTIPVHTLNKVWIVPDKARVYEHGSNAYVVSSRLKVMLDSDYATTKTLDASKQNTTNEQAAVTKEIIRKVILPVLEEEVNTGAHFAQLRQMYTTMVLAAWYKTRLKESILNNIYSNQNKVAGIDINDPQSTDAIYQQYLKTFKQGIYNYIKEEVDPATQKSVARKYFSGGANMNMTGKFETFRVFNQEVIDAAQQADVTIRWRADKAMAADGSGPVIIPDISDRQILIDNIKKAMEAQGVEIKITSVRNNVLRLEVGPSFSYPTPETYRVLDFKILIALQSDNVFGKKRPFHLFPIRDIIKEVIKGGQVYKEIHKEVYVDYDHNRVDNSFVQWVSKGILSKDGEWAKKELAPTYASIDPQSLGLYKRFTQGMYYAIDYAAWKLFVTDIDDVLKDIGRLLLFMKPRPTEEKYTRLSTQNIKPPYATQIPWVRNEEATQEWFKNTFGSGRSGRIAAVGDDAMTGNLIERAVAGNQDLAPKVQAVEDGYKEKHEGRKKMMGELAGGTLTAVVKKMISTYDKEFARNRALIEADTEFLTTFANAAGASYLKNLNQTPFVELLLKTLGEPVVWDEIQAAAGKTSGEGIRRIFGRKTAVGADSAMAADPHWLIAVDLKAYVRKRDLYGMVLVRDNLRGLMYIELSDEFLKAKELQEEKDEFLSFISKTADKYLGKPATGNEVSQYGNTVVISTPGPDGAQPRNERIAGMLADYWKSKNINGVQINVSGIVLNKFEVKLPQGASGKNYPDFPVAVEGMIESAAGNGFKVNVYTKTVPDGFVISYNFRDDERPFDYNAAMIGEVIDRLKSDVSKLDTANEIDEAMIAEIWASITTASTLLFFILYSRKKSDYKDLQGQLSEIRRIFAKFVLPAIVNHYSLFERYLSEEEKLDVFSQVLLSLTPQEIEKLKQDAKLPQGLRDLANANMLWTAPGAKPKEDNAQVGGIDFNSNKLDLMIKRDEDGMPLPAQFQNLEQLKINGLTPVILNISPVKNLPLMLGLEGQPSASTAS